MRKWNRLFGLTMLLVIVTLGCRRQATQTTTPLHRAASACDTRSIESLISGGADVNARDWHGRTPLHRIAARQTTYSNWHWTPNSRDAVAALIGHGAQVNARDKYGRTPLHYALRSGDEDVARLLVAGGADVNAADNKGNTPLHIAAWRGLVDIADLLIAGGANIHARDTMGSTPLHAATAGTRNDLIDLLLNRGANIDVPDEKGRTPVEYAALRSNFACVEFLVSKGARLASSAGVHRSPADDPVGAMVAIAQPNVKTVTQGNSTFACDLYQRLRSAEGNLFFSPYSISTALAMTYAGARGDTEKQIAETLHFSLDQQDLHPAMAALQGWLSQVQRQGSVKLLVANSLWPQQGYRFLEQYLSLARQHYGVTITPVDYVHAPEPAREQINRWVEEKTERRITNLIQPGLLDPLTRLVLVNAIYFKGQWAEQFNPRNTKNGRFHIAKDQSNAVPMMSQTAKAGYAEFDDVQILALPYRGDDLSMLIMLPREIDGLGGIEERLSAEEIDVWRGPLRTQKVRIFLPRFTVTCQLGLAATFRSMGMTDAFSLPPADFSGMTGSRDLYIRAVLHKAFVEVNEEGTEAAAATAVVAVKKRGDDPPTFRADHPFLFVIQENRTGSILFMGRVTNPTQTGS